MYFLHFERPFKIHKIAFSPEKLKIIPRFHQFKVGSGYPKHKYFYLA